ncbi:hypothetical protein SUNI508_02913 [Seiridium unicorne]|uniref:Uncharacterized protein n=1 Tax=Seiridium unicorne TaxID=138068 RepID=A0ABR2VHQ9_9PEZI
MFVETCASPSGPGSGCFSVCFSVYFSVYFSVCFCGCSRAALVLLLRVVALYPVHHDFVVGADWNTDPSASDQDESGGNAVNISESTEKLSMSSDLVASTNAVPEMVIAAGVAAGTGRTTPRYLEPADGISGE